MTLDAKFLKVAMASSDVPDALGSEASLPSTAVASADPLMKTQGSAADSVNQCNSRPFLSIPCQLALA